MRATPSSSRLLVGYVLHPFNSLAIQLFRNRDVRHRGRWRRAVPMLFTRRDPHDIARADLVSWPAPSLNRSDARDDDQRLAERVRVPRRACTGSKVTVAPGECSPSRTLI